MLGTPPYWFSPLQEKVYIEIAYVPPPVTGEDPAAAGAKRGRSEIEECQFDLFNRPAGPPPRLLPPLEAAINIAGEKKQDIILINEPGQFAA